MNNIEEILFPMAKTETDFNTSNVYFCDYNEYNQNKLWIQTTKMKINEIVSKPYYCEYKLNQYNVSINKREIENSEDIYDFNSKKEEEEKTIIYISKKTKDNDNVKNKSDDKTSNAETINATSLSYLKLCVEYLYLLLVSATPSTGLGRLDKMLEPSFWARLGAAVGLEYGNRYSRLFNWVGVGPDIMEIAFNDWIDLFVSERIHSVLESEEFAKKAATLKYQLDLFLELSKILDTSTFIHIFCLYHLTRDVTRYTGGGLQENNCSLFTSNSIQGLTFSS